MDPCLHVAQPHFCHLGNLPAGPHRHTRVASWYSCLHEFRSFHASSHPTILSREPRYRWTSWVHLQSSANRATLDSSPVQSWKRAWPSLKFSCSTSNWDEYLLSQELRRYDRFAYLSPLSKQGRSAWGGPHNSNSMLSKEFPHQQYPKSCLAWSAQTSRCKLVVPAYQHPYSLLDSAR